LETACLSLIRSNEETAGLVAVTFRLIAHHTILLGNQSEIYKCRPKIISKT